MDINKTMQQFHKEAKDYFASLPSSVQKEIENIHLEWIRYTMRFLKECDSPIEQLLLLRIFDEFGRRQEDCYRMDSSFDYWIAPQYQVETFKNKYKLDIGIGVTFLGKTSLFAIECDGHDFHEKTKEQASADRNRERKIMEQGFHVIRFTGSEIVKSPASATGETLNIIEKITGISDEYSRYIDRQLAADLSRQPNPVGTSEE